jgi:hypothetical protein
MSSVALQNTGAHAAVTGALLSSSERRLAARGVLALDARRSIAIKRNQHEVVLAAPIDDVVATLSAQLSRPGASFGVIDVRRAAARVGKPFELGERFESVVCIERLLTGRLGLLGRWLEPVLRSRAWAFIAERFIGDFAEVSLLELSGPGPRRVRYRYLEGCPMAGDSEYLVEALGPDRTRVRVTFTFQELGALAITILHRFGLRVHDDAVRAQITAVAEQLGVEIVSSTM